MTVEETPDVAPPTTPSTLGIWGITAAFATAAAARMAGTLKRILGELGFLERL